jgi:hypothetical protein
MSQFIDRSSVSIGADPEFFLKIGEQFISGHGFSTIGTKAEPRKTAHGAVQRDGVALEVNVDPAFTEEKFVQNLRGVLYDLNQIVRGWSKEAYLVAEPVAPFKKAFLDRIPAEFRALGCTPDYNAYSLEQNPLPDAEVQFRTGSGHLHIGWTEGAEGYSHFEKCARLVRQLDYTVGLRTLLFDAEPRRRILYGKAGAFRQKSYGVEYRTPSNAWCADEKLARSMFRGCVLAIDLLNKGTDLDKETKGLAKELIDNNKTDWHTQYPKLADLIIGEP